MNDCKPGYYAVIPAQVRYDTELRPNAKLLYGELTALAGADGYCWASDKYFAELFGLSAKTVSELIQSLRRRGYIRVEMSANSRGTERHIYAGVFLVSPASEGGIPKNTDTPEKAETPEGGYPEKCGEGSPDFSGSYKDNNINITKITPIVPQGGRRAAKSVPKHEPELFERFWQAYPQVMRKDRAGAVREWDKLRPDMALMRVMSEALKRQKETELWRRGVGIPYPVRWLRKQRWTDETEEDTVPAPSSRAAPADSYIPEAKPLW